jgi:hypothetical protein
MVRPACSSSELTSTISRGSEAFASEHTEGTRNPHQLLELGNAAAAEGDLEVAYLLYARGSLFTGADKSLNALGRPLCSQLAAGKLQTLAALCQPPTAAAVVAAAGVASQPYTSSPCTGFAHQAASFKRWKQMQQRLPAHFPGSSSQACDCSLEKGPSCTPQQPQTPTTKPAAALAQQQHLDALGSSSPCDPATTHPHKQRLASDNATTSVCGVCSSSSSSSSASTLWCTSSRTCACSCTPTSCVRKRRVFCASDLHVDRAGGANMQWLKSISSSSFQQDVLIVAGRVGCMPSPLPAGVRV